MRWAYFVSLAHRRGVIEEVLEHLGNVGRRSFTFLDERRSVVNAFAKKLLQSDVGLECARREDRQTRRVPPYILDT